MRIRPSSNHGDISFIVEAENESDLALLTIFTSSKWREGKEFRMHSHTYEGDVSGASSFNFGWAEPFKMKPEDDAI